MESHTLLQKDGEQLEETVSLKELLQLHPFVVRESQLGFDDGHFFKRCDGDVFFSYYDAISIIFGDILPSPSVRLFFQIIGTDYFTMFFQIFRTDGLRWLGSKKTRILGESQIRDKSCVKTTALYRVSFF